MPAQLPLFNGELQLADRACQDDDRRPLLPEAMSQEDRQAAQRLAKLTRMAKLKGAHRSRADPDLQTASLPALDLPLHFTWLLSAQPSVQSTLQCCADSIGDNRVKPVV